MSFTYFVVDNVHKYLIMMTLLMMMMGLILYNLMVRSFIDIKLGSNL